MDGKDKILGKARLKQIKITNEPCPIYIDLEMVSLLEDAILDLKPIGMYKYLTLIYS